MASEKAFINIIPLGGDCQISFALTKLNLRAASSIFEWHLIQEFRELLFAFESFLNGDPLPMEIKPEMPGNIFWKGTTVRTGHYELEKYNDIYKRRWKRLLLQIESGEPLLFIREDLEIQITEEELAQFQKLIERINPESPYTILIISSAENFNEIKMERVFHKKRYEKVGEPMDTSNLQNFIEEAASPYRLSLACAVQPNDDKD
jgi:hypothetical protein